MNKLLLTMTLTAVAALLSLTGCSKSSGVDTTKVQSSFQSAAAVDKAEVDKAIALVKSGDYSGALASLQKAVVNVRLTPEQKGALEDLVEQVKIKLGEAAKKAVEDTSKAAKEGMDKAVGDLNKTLGR